MVGEEGSKRGTEPTVVRAEGANEQSAAQTLPATLLEQCPVGLLALDDDGCVVYANPAVGAALGRPPEEIRGASFGTLLIPDHRPYYLRSLVRYLRTGSSHLDWEGIDLPMCHRDHGEIWMTASVRHNENSDPAVVVLQEADDRTNRVENLREQLVFTESILDTVPDVFFAFDEAGNFLRWNDRSEVTGYEPEEIAEMQALDFIPEEDQPLVAETIVEVLTDGGVRMVESSLLTKDGERIPYEFKAGRIVDDDGTILGIAGTGREVTERKAREELLERQRDELTTLNRINGVIRAINTGLVSAGSREEVKETVCDRLHQSELYYSAWVGEPDIADEAVRPQGEFGAESPAEEPSAAEITLATEAARTNAVQIVRGADDQIHAAVPLVYGETTYGALVVTTDRPDALVEREQSVLSELGRTIGHAINAVESKRLLFTDTAVELELDLSGTDAFFIEASKQLACSFTLEHVLPTADDGLLYYVTVEGADKEALTALATQSSKVADARLIGEHDGQATFEFTFFEGAAASRTLVESGAIVTGGIVDSGQGVLFAEVAPDANVRAILDTVKAVYPEVTLAGKREIERSVETAAEFRHSLLSQLTDRQRSCLEAAYFGGYYDNPRTSTGEEIATSLGITASTFHQHLRYGQRKLFTALFDTRSIAENAAPE